MKADRDILGESDVADRLRAAAESATAGQGLEHQHQHYHHPYRRAAAAYRARQAREWARTHWSDLKDGVERRPYSATAWALGIGLVTGIVLTALARPRRHL
jgi:hypothetical protein